MYVTCVVTLTQHTIPNAFLKYLQECLPLPTF